MHIKQIVMMTVPVATLGALAIAATASPVTRAGGNGTAAVHRQTVKTAVTTTTLYAGGATLPALAYVGKVTTNPQVTDAAGSAFYYYGHTILSGESVSYCQTGSGFGKKVLDGVNVSGSSDANLPCPALGVTPVTGTNGFGASGQDVADFAGSDAPFAATEYTSFATDGKVGSGNPIAGKIEPVQLPVLAGAVAIYYNNDDAAVEALGNLPLSDEAICKIADGSIANWSALYTELKAEGLAVGSTAFASKPLYWVSRYDGSGTSFSFTNHLANKCSSYTKDFGANQTYSLIITSNPTGANFVAASGNPGVASCIKSDTDCLVYASASPGTPVTLKEGSTATSDGAMGYVEAANVGSSVSKPEGYATVNGKDAFKDLPTAAALITASSLLTDVTVTQTVSGGGPATTATQTPAGTAKCLLVVNPTTVATPTSGYPIIAVTNLEFSEKLNQGKATQDQDLVKMFYSSTNFGTGKITSVDVEGAATGKTGYSTLNIPSTNSTIATAIGCIGT